MARRHGLCTAQQPTELFAALSVGLMRVGLMLAACMLARDVE